MLTAKNIVKRYGGREEAPALDGIDLAIGRGEFVCLTGRSGSGKSTLLNALSTLLRPDSGELRYEGRDLTALTEKERNALRSTDFAMIFQMHHLLPYLTAMENVMAPALKNLRPVRAAMKEKAAALLSRVGLSGKEGRLPGELSGGERQRAAVARALFSSPRALFADEPTGSLDKATAREILDLLRELNNDGLTVVMVTHDPSHAAAADRVIRLQDGRILDRP